MGVDTRLVVYAPDEQSAATACRAAFDRLADLEDTMSDYRPTSELMRLCARSGGPPTPISDDLYRVLSRGQLIAAQSDGSFDMTVGPLVRLWRTARKTHQLPDPTALAQAKSLTGYQNLLLSPAKPTPSGMASPTAQLLKPGMLLDLGGIAKGDAGDQALSVLHQHGIHSALYQAGGDIVLSNPPPHEKGWTISLPHPPTSTPIAGTQPVPGLPPLSPTTQPTESTLTLSNCALSTSGDSNQFLDINGTRYSHLLNPHTGLGLTSRTLVTVIAPAGLTSDPLSKAASILPPTQLQQLLQHHPHITIYTRHLPLGPAPSPPTPISSFGLRASFGFRVSSFEFPSRVLRPQPRSPACECGVSSFPFGTGHTI